MDSSLVRSSSFGRISSRPESKGGWWISLASCNSIKQSRWTIVEKNAYLYIKLLEKLSQLDDNKKEENDEAKAN